MTNISFVIYLSFICQTSHLSFQNYEQDFILFILRKQVLQYNYETE